MGRKNIKRAGSGNATVSNDVVPGQVVYQTGVSNDTVAQANANMINDMTNVYANNYIPQERELAEQLNDRSIVEDASKNANKSFNTALGRSRRDISRYGLRQTAAHRDVTRNKNKAARVANYIDQMTDAQLQQYDRNIGLRNSLIDIGRGHQADAMSQYSAQASAATDRSNAYDTGKTQADNAKRQQNAQLVTTAIMIAAMS